MENFGVFNSAHGADRSASATSNACSGTSRRRPSTSSRSRRGEAQLVQGGALARRHRRPHRPLAQGQVRRPRRHDRERRLVGQQRRRSRPSSSTLLLGRFPRATPRARSSSSRTSTAAPIRRTACTGAGLHRIRLAHALHPQPADPPGARASSPASCPDFTIIDLPSFKADPARHGCRTRDGDRRRLHRAGSC